MFPSEVVGNAAAAKRAVGIFIVTFLYISICLYICTEADSVREIYCDQRRCRVQAELQAVTAGDSRKQCKTKPHCGQGLKRKGGDEADKRTAGCTRQSPENGTRHRGIDI